ncbi:cell adhesion molecule 2-like, partial [Limulus polyphemus]|uniref:Cell adhesion molecule 2-like n=1 Tax=Limulus polyphemus TaxID=6850 RepID=A0ABM1BXE0_LIMPO
MGAERGLRLACPDCKMRIQGSVCLQFIDIEVNSVVQKGDPLWLNCTFDQESDDLYSVKWYKNSVEFYRYLPKEQPQAQSYDQPGVYIDMAKSSVGHVFLYKTDLESEGMYRCEVSAEAPSFQTERAEKELHIYVLPKEKPTVTGTRDHYNIGDFVNVTCIAEPSKPPASLKWYVNDKK